jgi:stage II sporulation protein R
MKKQTKNKLRLWEVALLLGLALSLLTAAWAEGTQIRLAGEVLRLHVIANSDSEADQAQKLRVRDVILTEAQELLAQCTTRQEAEATLSAATEQLEQAAQAQLRREGSLLPVSVSLETTWFPTKEYGGFSLPQGNYQALRVVIGEGAGQNWWCVVFPPLCLAASEDTAQAALAAGVSQEDVDLITQSDGEYTLKFKVVELWEEWKARLN